MTASVKKIYSDPQESMLKRFHLPTTQQHVSDQVRIWNQVTGENYPNS